MSPLAFLSTLFPFITSSVGCLFYLWRAWVKRKTPVSYLFLSMSLLLFASAYFYGLLLRGYSVTEIVGPELARVVFGAIFGVSLLLGVHSEGLIKWKI